jgi:tRNA 2-thiouridine synthesizing protein A
MLTGPIDADQSLDTTGLYCPIPVVKTSEKIKQMPVGAVLEVISDDGGIEADLPAWCEGYGHDFLGSFHDSGRWLLYIKKNDVFL